MKKEKTLTKAEMQIMSYLWVLPESKGTIYDILECYPDKKPAYTTVATFMKILLNKGFVDFEKVKGSKTQIYFPLITKEEYTEQVLSDVKDNLFGGSFSSLVRFFVKEEKISESKLKEILDMLGRKDE
jgi:putative antibiotic resistance-related regulatory protein